MIKVRAILNQLGLVLLLALAPIMQGCSASVPKQDIGYANQGPSESKAPLIRQKQGFWKRLREKL